MARPRTPERVFTRKPPDTRMRTSESIATDIAAFEAAGGAIEVLGTTPRLKRIGVPEPQETGDPSATTGNRS